jgi:adenosylcobyric acid synthase
MAAVGDIAQPVLPDGLGWQSANGHILGVYLHGLFEDAGVLRALFGADVPTLDTVFDGLADFVDARFAPGQLMALLAPQPR